LSKLGQMEALIGSFDAVKASGMESETQNKLGATH